ncbi:YcxB family protein [Aliiroseovarius halocynthiae]|uniref:YcxB family protein n=1 Tax=Aliiroseovarius halocynthiae TaxID=985055 RepID=A0A545STT7_9RHOB|nr:YcxB family protein [Aliiroseovarius halocynthiae]TQV68376.1 YcxB family protein [Aliiroseovarius halocynthiae]
MSTTLEYYSRFDAIDVDYALRAMAAERRRRAKGWGGKARTLILSIAFICVAAIVAIASASGVWVFLSFMPLLGAGFYVLQHSRNSYQTTLSKSPLRGGVVRIVLSALGMRITHPGYEVVISWSHMEGVIVTERGLLLMIDVYDYCPLAKSAFSSDADMQEVVAQIEAWRAAGVAQPSKSDA